MSEYIPPNEEISKRIENCRLSDGKVLDISNMGLTEFPEEIRSLKNLVDLNASLNRLTQIPEWLGEMTNFRRLALNYNIGIESLPESLNNLSDMEILNISFIPLKEFPDFICKYKKLNRLSIGGIGTALEPMQIPVWIGEFSELEYLYLGSPVGDIPQNIDGLKTLRRLDINAVNIKTLPVYKLAALEELFIIHDCYLEKPPESFGDLSAPEYFWDILMNTKIIEVLL
jgi:Leucine-rich repeat (LRR) protein